MTEGNKDFDIIRPLSSAEESSSWIKSTVAIMQATGQTVIISRLNKDLFIQHHMPINPQQKISPEDLVALKERAIKKYNEEAENFATINKKALGLRHPNIVSVINVGKDNETGENIIIRDFYSGSSIFEITEGLTVEGMMPIFIGMIDAIDFMHRKRLLHLNLKPKRVRVLHEPSSYTVKVTDYGWAVGFGEAREFLYGVPSFSAPEVILKQKNAIDMTADLYSIGAIMYYCLTRALPFPQREGIKQTDRLQEIVQEENEPMKPSERNPQLLDLPHVGGTKFRKDPEKVKQFDEVVMSLLIKDIKKRPFITALDLKNKIRSIFGKLKSGQMVSSAVITTVA